jgi:lipopolysaccharide export system permease protein
VNLLDRHLFKSVFGTCAAAVALFTFIVALPNVIRDLVGPLLAGQIDLGTFLHLLAFLPPFAITYALPMGILTGVLLTLGRLSADSEITAMRASGISVLRIARPVFLLGVLGAALALYVNFESMPHARVTYHVVLANAVRSNPLSFIVPRTFIRDFRNHVVYVGEKEGAVLRDIWLWELDDQKRVKRLVRAESGRIEYDEATNSLIPTLLHAQAEDRDPDNPEDFSKSPKIGSIERFEETRIPLDTYFRPNEVKVKIDWFNYAQLRAEEERLASLPPPPPAEAKQRARDLMRPAVVMNDKLNLSLAVFAFALIGVPLGIKVSRRETSANLGLALLLVLGFYLLTVMVKWLDRHPEYRPDLLLWVPNLLFLALGVWLFRRIERN